jgi:hypothetical protein
MDSGNLSKIGKELAHKLCEPKVGLIVGVVELLGVDMAKELFSQTRDAELKGGMMIKNGERRRTPGGVFLQLLRDTAHQDPRIDAQKVFFFNFKLIMCFIIFIYIFIRLGEAFLRLSKQPNE